jgi:uncharacterized DUF497 family protein
MFAWDETKRRANLKKHGIDFADAKKSSAGSLSAQRTRGRYMENGGF